MILLDTDHLTVLAIPDSDRRNRLVARMALDSAGLFGVAIVSIEEQIRGWFASVARERDVARHVGPYRRLAELLNFYQSFETVLFDAEAAEHFKRLRSAKSRVSTMDLKIASIALAQDALLLTANRRDFEQVPGLRFENWMDPPKVS